MRSKEVANDYRYFPEPDLLPVILEESFIESIKANMPELPAQKKDRFIDEYNLSAYDASVLSADIELAHFFEEALNISNSPKLTANWVMGDLSAFLNKENISISDSKINSENLGLLINRIEDSTISGKTAKEVFELMWFELKDADQIIEERDLQQVTDLKAIEDLVNNVIKENPDQLSKYKSGKDKLFGFFVGQVMKASKGKANPAQVNDLLNKKLKE
jgi:aspartyl-tRNA(Asn)/glutamyl-tRNA(Gln) amidotransferase subunit B